MCPAIVAIPRQVGSPQDFDNGLATAPCLTEKQSVLNYSSDDQAYNNLTLITPSTWAIFSLS